MLKSEHAGAGSALSFEAKLLDERALRFQLGVRLT